MSFLDNAGSVILDCVLTDTGRMRLAAGSFRISKFAIGDDEISYNLYNKSHPSGSAYYDLEILQTPILEAMTNNIASMNSKLISINRTNLLYLPIIKINEVNTTANKMHSLGAFVVAVDKATETSFANVNGILTGETLNGGTIVRLDQGLDTTEISPAFTIDSDLVETQYITIIDNRFGKLISSNGTLGRLSFLDDDSIASYYFSLGTDTEFVSENLERVDISSRQTIRGPRGTILTFKLQSSLDLNTSTFLFEKLGSTTTMTSATGAAISVYYIDSYIRVTGATTGFSLDIPVRFIKNA